MTASRGTSTAWACSSRTMSRVTKAPGRTSGGVAVASTVIFTVPVPAMEPGRLVRLEGDPHVTPLLEAVDIFLRQVDAGRERVEVRHGEQGVPRPDMLTQLDLPVGDVPPERCAYEGLLEPEARLGQLLGGHLALEGRAVVRLATHQVVRQQARRPLVG